MNHKHKIYFLIYDWKSTALLQTHTSKAAENPVFITLVHIQKLNGIPLPWSIIYISSSMDNITSGGSVSHLNYKYKSIGFPHSNIHNPHDSTHPQGMHSVIIYGINPGRCLFSTHLQLEASCITDNVLIFKVRNTWNILLSFSRKTLSLKHTEFGLRAFPFITPLINTDTLKGDPHLQLSLRADGSSSQDFTNAIKQQSEILS